MWYVTNTDGHTRSEYERWQHGDVMIIFVRTFTSKTIILQVDSKETIYAVKEKVDFQHGANCMV